MWSKKRGDTTLVFISFLIISLASAMFAYSVNESLNETYNASPGLEILDIVNQSIPVDLSNITTSDNHTASQFENETNITNPETPNASENIQTENQTSPIIDETPVVNDTPIIPPVVNQTSENTTQNIPVNTTLVNVTTEIENITVNLIVKDSKGNKVDSDVKKIKKIITETKVRKLKKSQEIVQDNSTTEEDVVEVTLKKGAVRSLDIRSLDLSRPQVLGIDDAPLDIPAPRGQWTHIYGIDPTNLNFTNATVTVTAKGASLYKCSDWDFSNQRCSGNWIFLQSITPGENYSIVLTPHDPGFGEIIATAAQHLDENYTLLGDVFDQIKAQDNLWTDAIYEGEYVRVTFETNLTDGRYIDVYAKNNNSLVLFDVYEAGTQHRVGTSGVFAHDEYQYIYISNLTKPTDTFDFKIVKEGLDPWIVDDSLGAIQFDYIHDDLINTTSADGLIGYSERNVATVPPRYRTFNVSKNFGAELSANSAGSNFTWAVVKGSWKRNEMIMGTEGKDLDIDVQIFNSSKVWEPVLTVATNVPLSSARAFDIAYEDVSGDALIVYENVTAAADSTIFYRTWNGTGYTAEQSQVIPLAASNINFIKLTPRIGTNEIMVTVLSAASDIAAMYWNGTAFDTDKNVTATTTAPTATEEHFAFGWETQAGDGVLVYAPAVGGTDNLVFRTFTGSTGAWSAASTIAALNTNTALHAARLCSDPNSNHIGLIYQEVAGPFVNAIMWNGTGTTFMAGLTGDTTTQLGGADNINVDCAWGATNGVALFGYFDAAGNAVEYFNFTRATDTFSIANIANNGNRSDSFGVGAIAGLRLVPNPVTNEIMAVSINGSTVASPSAIAAILWNGTKFNNISTTPLETNSDPTKGDQESAMFDWYRYDTPPVVKIIGPANASTYNISNIFNITANVTDNLAVDTVIANVTFPNGTSELIRMSGPTGITYNATNFADTVIPGLFTIRIFANDTSDHQNFNSTETTIIRVNDVKRPAVFDVRPVNSSVFTIGSTIDISANVTDDVAVENVTANITLPDASVQVLLLELDGGNKYNNTFTIPSNGKYNITFIANDTSGNVNSTIRTNFSVADNENPAVFDVRPVNSSSFNINDVVTISANVTDNGVVSQVKANVTFPNLTTQLITLVKDGTSNKYNNTFTAPAVLGNYNISFFANDTVNNINNTEKTNFSVVDTQNPAVFDVRPVNSTVFGIANTVTISANITDNDGIGTVNANLTFPNLTTQVITLVKDGTSNKYNNTFLTPAVLGNYNISFFSNDSSNNINDTIKTNFTVIDNHAPAVFDVRPVAGNNFNVSQLIEIAANVTDDLAVQNVTANITIANGSVQVLLLTLATGNKYNTSFTIPAVIGQYNITFIANDTSNNANSTTTTFFVSSDLVRPAVFDIRPVNSTVFGTSSTIEIAANVTDNVAVQNVTANLTIANGSVQVLLLTLATGNKYNTSFTIPDVLGKYNITFIANDTSGNVNNTIKTNFTAIDGTAPTILTLGCIPNPGNISQTVTCKANVTDNIAVSAVLANVTMPNGTVQAQTILISGITYNFTFTNTVIPGVYNVTWNANDTSANSALAFNNFTINDVVNPSVIDVRPINSTVFGIANTVTISANATDDVAVSLVRANVTFPNLTTQIISLTRDGSSNKYNNTFVTPAVLGNYNVSFFANDTSNNINNTIRTNFTVIDNHAPAVFDVRPTAGNNFNVSQSIEIAANVTDDLAVQNVTANLTIANGSVQVLLLSLTTGNKYNTSFTIPAVTGQYNITFIANDTSNNVNSTTTTFFVSNDLVNPAVLSDVRPVNRSVFNTSNTIEIAANVTDNVAVQNVTANVTLANGTVQVILLSLATGSKYNTSFTIPNILGNYNVTFVANDTSGNVNNTIKTNFTVNDRTPPAVFDVRPTQGSNYNASQTIEIAANVTDNIAVENVTANVTLANGSVQVLLLILATGNKYNTSFTIPALIGQYNITFIANDTSNNVNSTTTTFFVSNDLVNPAVFDIRPVNSSVFNASYSIEIAANVTDNVAVQNVTANVTLANGSVQVILLSLATGNKYNTSYTIPNILGKYNVTFIANDTSNNINNTIKTNFTVNDGTSPAVFDVRPVNKTTFNVGSAVTVSANVTDNMAVENVTANITFSNATVQTITLVRDGTSNKYNNTFTAPAVIGNYNVTFIANDTSGNVNNTVKTNFTVRDVVNPAVFDVRPVVDSNATIGSVIEVAANVTDDVAVGAIYVNVTLPDANIQQFALTLVTGNKYNASFTIPATLGVYNITFVANDTSNNINSTVKTNFTVSALAAPAVFDVRPVNSTIFNVGNTVTVSANVTDDIPVDLVRVNITMPNLTTAIVTLFRDGASDKYNNTFVAPAVIGNYNVNFFANDTSANFNNTEKTNFTVTDVVNPAVFDVRPVNSTVFGIANTVTISANVTDDVTVSQVRVNITFSNLTTQLITLVRDGTSNKYNNTFTTPAVLGNYNISFFANDTSNNINNTIKTNFTVVDNRAPAVFDVRPTAGNDYNVSQVIEIAANVTDDLAVQNVTANVTIANGSVQVLLLTLATGNKYNTSFTIPAVIGQYNITFIANDTSNNINSTTTTFFVSNDLIRPAVLSDVRPINSSAFNTSNIIEIAANVTDNVAVQNVTANVTLANGSVQVLLLTLATGNKYNTSFIIPNILGNYNVTFIANDTSGNVNNTIKTNFTVNDITKPLVFDVRPTAGNNFNVSQTIEIAANVTDNIAVENVTANLTIANGSVQVLLLTLATGNKYNTSFTIPSVIGQYNITFIANDTSNNVNSTTTTFFVSNDLVNPAVLTDVRPVNSSVYNISNVVTISANVTDNVAVNLVRVNVTFPNLTTQLVNLIRDGTTDKYNNTFVAPAVLGKYNISFFANDTSNNINNTIKTNFTVVDGKAPAVFDVRPTSGNDYNVSQVIEIAANVTDDLAVQNVTANVTIANGSVQVLLLTLATGNKYNTSFTIPAVIGQYNITFIANDTSNNVNSTTTTFFVSNDLVNPAVFGIKPINSSVFNTSNIIEIAANVTDNVKVENVTANVTLANGSVQVILLSLATGNKYNTSFTIPNVIGNYNVTIIANDTSGNVNNTIKTNFTVNDIVRPAVFDVIPIAQTQFTSSGPIEIAANVTDNIAVSTVLANITFPNLTTQVITLSLATGNKYNVSFTVPGLLGKYNISFFANDTSNNINNTIRTNFTLVDITNPAVFDVRPVNMSAFNVSDIVDISANVTDNVAVNFVRANVTFPNLTTQVITLTRDGSSDKYNNTFVAPDLLGNYNISYFANDTSNNINNTVRTNFTIEDTKKPLVFDLIPEAGSSKSIGASIEIGANITDNARVNITFANITFPNLTTQVLTLARVGSSNKYNTSFTVPDVAGRYNISFFANDTHSNINNTEKTFFLTNDTVAPSLYDLRPVNMSAFNASDVIEIAANITDSAGVDVAKVNITFPNLTTQILTLVVDPSSDKFNVTFIAPNIIGLYNISFYANDTFSNTNNTERTNFTVEDTKKPVVFDLRPVNTSTFSVAQRIEIAANVTDNGAVQNVTANVTLADGSVQVISLSLVTGNKYNTSFLVPAVLGNYNVTFIANDTSGNVNNTVKTNFTVIDNSAPTITTLGCTPNPGNVSQSVTCKANVTDDVLVSSVIANVTMPNGSVELQTILISGITYNFTYTNTAIPGLYNVTWRANDTSANSRVATDNFTINDLVNPAVIDVRPVNSSAYNISNIVTISANVTDDVSVNLVRVNITFSNTTTQLITLVRDGTSNKYNNTFTTPAILGNYNISFFANDTSNNINNTIKTNFTVVDGKAPAVFDVRPTAGNDYNVSQVIEIAANVTDDFRVQNVTANITIANGSVQVLLLSKATGDKYNTSFTIPAVIGQYNITFIANDTSNNLNTTTTTFFVSNDLVNPAVLTDVRPVNRSVFNTSNVIEIAANVTDNVAVENVTANVTIANGSVQVILLSRTTGNKYNTSFTIPNILGNYNVTFIANDTSGNVNNTRKTNFTVNDIVRPAVFDVLPVNSTLVDVASSIEIAANVTDNIAVQNVTANVTIANGSVQVLLLTLATGNKYNTSFTAPAVIGNYNVIFIANDTSGNVNNTIRTNFTVRDVVNPAVFDIRPVNSSVYNISNIVTISANVTDDVSVSFVRVNITFSNTTTQLITLVRDGTSNRFNNTFTTPAVLGLYNISFFANDTSNNVNNTIKTNFTVVDGKAPAVFDVRPTAGNDYNVSQVIEIAANVTDDLAVQNVTANVTIANGSVQVLLLTLATGNKYNTSFTIPAVIGQYNITFIANDTSNNVNSTTTTFFVSNDLIRPAVIDIRPVNSSTFNVSNVVTISANVTDNVAVNLVRVNVTLPNLTTQLVTLIRDGTTDKYNNTFIAPAVLGNYNISFFANDTSNNINNTIRTNFTVRDVVNPAVSSDVRPVNKTSFQVGRSIEIAANATDDVDVENVTANIILPNASVQVILLSPATGNRYNTSFIIPNIIGNYNVTFIANDTSGNVNNTRRTNFTANDVTRPSVSTIQPIFVNEDVQVNYNATVIEDVEISSCTLYKNGEPDGPMSVVGTLANRSVTLSDPGTYSFLANCTDTSGNYNDTSLTTVTVNDTTRPAVIDIRPINSSIFSISDVIEIAANVTDNFAVQNVTANVTLANGSVQVLLLTLATGNKYNTSFIAPALIGNYNVTFIANDTSGNVNNTIRTNFTVRDVVNPAVFDVRPTAGNDYNVSNIIEIAANVTDDLAVSQVKANITLPNLTVQQITLNLATGNKYNTSFTIPAVIGQYNITFIANDTSNNFNTTTTTFFVSNDLVNPAVFGIKPINSSVFNVSNIIEIAANVTDTVGVENVTVNVTLANGSVQVLLLTLATGNKYNTSFTAPALIGNYNVTFIANDTSGNVNNTIRTNFTVRDVVRPAVIDIRPINSSIFNVSNIITISANVTDDVAVNLVRVNITFSNATTQLLTLVRDGSSNKYNNTFTAPALIGNYNVNFFANDTSNNINNTIRTNFTVRDVVNPAVFDVRPTAGNDYNVSQTIEIAANVTDDVAVQNVTANITIANGSVQVLLLTLATGNKYNTSFTIPAVIGQYNITFIANDTSNNVNSTITTFFVSNDLVNPAVSTIQPIFVNENMATNYNATVTDAVGISSCNLYINNANNGSMSVVGTLANRSVTLFDPGTYSFLANCTDTSGNYNDTSLTTVTVNDTTRPAVIDIRPVNSSVFNVTNIVTISANVTDNVNVSFVRINITFPDLTTQIINLVRDGTSNKYNNTFTIPSVVGNYNISYFANDTNNNINNSIKTNFTAVDGISPAVFDVLSIDGSVFNTSNSIEIAANVTDDVEVSQVRINITLPNASVQQLSLSLATGDKYNTSFTIPNLTGQYNITFIANDTSNNVNSTTTTTFDVNDIVSPVVFDVRPIASSLFNVSEIVIISANVTDNIAVSQVRVNITFSNATTRLLILTKDGTSNRYNTSFIAPAVLGLYNISYFANDTSNNINNTIRTNFTIRDVIAPNITVRGCFPSSTNLSLSVSCNSTVVDDVFVDTVTANVTLPNGTVEMQNVFKSGTTYNFTFITTALTGVYNVIWRANDTSNNIRTATDSFNVSDVNSPFVVSNNPTDGFNASSSTVTFNFTGIDNFNTQLNCSVFIDSVSRATNATSVNASETLLAVNSIAQGNHAWNVSCIDASSNTNTSTTRRFTVDTENPIFYSLTFDPNNENDLDPGVNITVFANVTDNLTGVDGVILERVLVNETTATNLTLVFDSGTGFYIGTFNATASGRYNLSLIANDTASNEGKSNVVNINVEFEKNWTRSPVTFSPVSANQSTNVTLGTLLINNSADYALDFNITSSSSTTRYNETENFTLAPHSEKTLIINDTATATKSVILNISAGPNAAPPSLLTTGNIVVLSNQPVLNAFFVTPSGDTLTVTDGQTNVEFIARVENIGQSNASNVTLSVHIPNNWVVTLGSVNFTIDLIEPGQVYDNVIDVTPSGAGTFPVTANASGVNDTGVNLASMNLTFGDLVTVTVNPKPRILGGGGGSTPPVIPPVSTRGGGGGGTVIKAPTGQTIYTNELVVTPRGTSEPTIIVISNLYENAVLLNPKLAVLGFLSQYVSITPKIDYNKEVFVESLNVPFIALGIKQPVTLSGLGEHFIQFNSIGIDDITFTFFSNPITVALQIGETKKYDLDGDGKNDVAFKLNAINAGVPDLKIYKIGPPDPNKIYYPEDRIYEMRLFAPSYLTQTEFNLTVKISADLTAVNPLLAGFTSVPLVEYRTFIFRILETTPEQINIDIAGAEKAIQDMENAGFPSVNTRGMLEEARSAIANNEYGKALRLIDEIEQKKKDAFETDGLIKEIINKIASAKAKGLDVPLTENSLSLAKKAFEREDFKTALERAKETALVLLLETEGRINVVLFIKNYWWALILGTIAGGFAIFISYRELQIFLIRLRIKNIDKEENVLIDLVEEAQNKRFRDKTISSEEYEQISRNYNKRLNGIRQERIELRNEQLLIVRAKQGIKNIEKEEKALLGLMKKAQEDYIKEGKITRSKFFDIYRADKEKIAELEEEKEKLEGKLRKEKKVPFKANERSREIPVKHIKQEVKIERKKGRNKFIKFIKRLFVRDIDQKIENLTRDIEEAADRFEKEKSRLKRK